MGGIAVADFSITFRRIAIGVGAVVLLTLCLSSGFVTGVLMGERGAYHRRYREEKELIDPILATDPMYQVLEVVESSSGGVSMFGELPTRADRDRLRRELVRVVGESRADSILWGVYPKR